MRRTMPLWAAVGVTNCLPSSSVARIAWQESRRPCAAWRRKPRRGQNPQPVEESPSDKAQSNFPDAELHIMRTTTKGGDYCGNAQASVDATCQSMLSCEVTDASNEKQQAEPRAQATLATLSQAGLERPRDDTGAAQAIAATLDSGYYSAAAVAALETMGFDPYMATGR